MLLTLEKRLREALTAHIAKRYGVELEIVVELPRQASHGDLATPVCFGLAKHLRRAPRQIASELVAELEPVPGIGSLEVAGAGYVNARFDRCGYALAVLAGVEEPLAESTKAIVEHTNINPNKAAHIGHLRNAVLGDTLVRMLRATGRRVETQNYIDNTGVQVADVVAAFHFLRKLSVSEVRALVCDPAIRFDHYCWDLYAEISRRFEEDRELLAWRAATLSALEEGEGDLAALGEVVADAIVDCHLDTMRRLGVAYDVLPRESEILKLHFWAAAFEQLKAREAIYLETDGKNAGCWVMPGEMFRADPSRSAPNEEAGGESEREGAKVIVRSDGTVTYVGKDIAYQLWKFGLLGCDFRYAPHGTQRSGHPLWTTTSTAPGDNDGSAPRPGTPFGRASSVYNVIDTRQSYLQQLLAQALAAAGRPEEAARSTHVSYEMVALSRRTAEALGFPLEGDANQRVVEVSGRKGLGVKADDLLDRLTAAARAEVVARHDDLAQDAEEANRIAGIIACAAIRYFMIKYSRGKLIAFDIDEALSFEGESGPYLQYATVRATNILRKLAETDGTDAESLMAALDDLPDIALTADADSELWALFLEASRLDEVADQSMRSLELSVLAKYAFSLAQQFNAFYHRAPVVAEADRPTQLWRAAVVLHVRNQLTKALDLMGCEVPGRM